MTSFVPVSTASSESSEVPRLSPTKRRTNLRRFVPGQASSRYQIGRLGLLTAVVTVTVPPGRDRAAGAPDRTWSWSHSVTVTVRGESLSHQDRRRPPPGRALNFKFGSPGRRHRRRQYQWPDDAAARPGRPGLGVSRCDYHNDLDLDSNLPRFKSTAG